MKIPEGYTEEEVFHIIDEILTALAIQFQFGSYEIEDLKQEGWVEAIKALEKFQPEFKYKLNHFIYGHVRRRLINFKRDHYFRPELPCHGCFFFDPQKIKSTNCCAAFLDKRECRTWRMWENRNNFKKNLHSPSDIYDLGENVEPIESERAQGDLIEYIRHHLDISLMGDFLRMIEGAKMSKQRKNRVVDAVKKILENIEENYGLS